ncbi:MAG: ISKra4 family transposase [Sandaracinaceae bacterium]
MNELLELADEEVRRAREGGDAVDYGAFEEAVAEQTAAVERAVHGVTLAALDIDAPFVKVWGKTYRRVHRAERTFGTLSGPVKVTRTLYRLVGQRRAASLDVVAQRAGVVDRRWLPGTARAMAHLLAQGTSREARSTSQELLRLPYSRCSFERVGHAVGAEYLSRRAQVEPKLIEAFEMPEESAAISVAVDRVSVPMEEPVPPQRDAAPVSAEDRARIASVRPAVKLDERTAAALAEANRTEAEATPPVVARNYRMAYCATVSIHDAKGRALHTIRHGRMPPTPGSVEAATHRAAKQLMERLCADVIALRSKAELPVVLLADGAPELWRLYDQHLSVAQLGIEPIRLVDAWHALEYVASAARLLEARGRRMPGIFRDWRSKLLEQPDGASLVLEELEEAGLTRATDESGRRPVGDAIRYIGSRLPKMRYAEARAAGLPIGSGTVEATCKSLVAIRMKRPGSRWKPRTGDEVLQLRALQLSDRWAPAMERTLKPLRKSVRVVPRPAKTA